ncbi:MAG: twin-arginine translocation pathway signal protein [Pseudomonadota bacterium]
MSKTPEADRSSRRAFLKLASSAAPAALVATASGAAAADVPAAPDLSLDRLQDTEHTRAYYEAARF